jgi:hypothetical protein
LYLAHKIVFIFTFIFVSSLAWANNQFNVSDCRVDGFIIENVGYMHTISMSSGVDVRATGLNQHTISKALSSSFSLRVFINTENQTLKMNINIYKNNKLFKRKTALAHLANQRVDTYYSSEIELSNIYSARPALDDSELLGVKLRCLVGRKSNWLWQWPDL